MKKIYAEKKEKLWKATVCTAEGADFFYTKRIGMMSFAGDALEKMEEVLKKEFQEITHRSDFF